MTRYLKKIERLLSLHTYTFLFALKYLCIIRVLKVLICVLYYNFKDGFELTRREVLYRFIRRMYTPTQNWFSHRFHLHSCN